MDLDKPAHAAQRIPQPHVREVGLMENSPVELLLRDSQLIVTVLLAARLVSEVLKTESLIGGALILIAVRLWARRNR
jgi:hypothetical protein